MSVLKPNPPSLPCADLEVGRDLYRRLRKRITLTEKNDLLKDNPDTLAYHLKLIRLAELRGVKVE